jgi:tyrosine-protein kinase Etk/Wzc
LIAGFVLAATVAAFVMSRLSPKLYESTAVILPSSDESKGGVGLNLGSDEGGKEGKEEKGSGGGGLAGLFGQMTSTTDILKSILNSRTMADAVIEELNLKSYYGTESMTATRKALKGETTIMVNREKAFFITVESKDPQMAANIANAYVAHLDRLNRQLNVTSATRNRLFIERRMDEKRQALAKAEEDRKQFQVANKTLLVTDKAKAAMATAGSIEESILGLEVELAGLKEYARPSHPMFNQIDAQMQALRKQLDRLEQRQEAQLGVSARKGQPAGRASKEFYPPALEVPDLALQYIRLHREVKIHEAVLTMLMGQYEQAKIAEARDTPTIQVLDPAIPAEYKSKPRTLHNMQLAGALSLVLGILLVLFLDHLQRLKAEEAALLPKRDGGVELAAGDQNGHGYMPEVYPVAPEETERLHR